MSLPFVDGNVLFANDLISSLALKADRDPTTGRLVEAQSPQGVVDRLNALENSVSGASTSASNALSVAQAAKAEADAALPSSAAGTTVATLTSGVLTPAQVPLIITDGTHTVTNATSLTVSGATVGGGNGAATLTLPAGGGGGGGAGTYTRPAASEFAPYNWQVGTRAFDKPSGPLTWTASIQNGNYLQTYDHALPSAANWTWATRVRIAQSNDSYITAGLILRDSIGGGIILIGGFQSTLGIFNYRDNANLAGEVWGSSWQVSFHEFDFMATDDGQNRSYFLSCDGVLPLDDPNKCWLPIYTPQSRSTFLVPDRVGVGANVNWGQGAASGTAMPVCVSIQQWLLKTP